MQHEKLSENLINLKVYLWVNENMRKKQTHREKRVDVNELVYVKSTLCEFACFILLPAHDFQRVSPLLKQVNRCFSIDISNFMGNDVFSSIDDNLYI